MDLSSDPVEEAAVRTGRPRNFPFALATAGALLLLVVGIRGRCKGDDDMPAPVESARNRLASETSPYLLQHADNPVHWYPWGREALDRAAKEDKPILLSIGYSACHWCHVMAQESFSNEEIAAVMNKHFVCIKVDREERPDLDEIYMNAAQMMTGRGGWPLTVFLTPDLKPFFGGTYFPPEDRYGMVGFPRVLARVAQAFRENREAIERDSDTVVRSLKRLSTGEAWSGPGTEAACVEPSSLDKASRRLMERLDPEYGGFGSAPKFPQPGALLFLLEEHARTKDEQTLAAATLTLRRMAEGGMRDHLAGGFHRYSVDRFWRVPHFEKMLYDNALLARVYTRAWQLTGDADSAATVRSTLDFLLKEMRHSGGGFYATLDADTEHQEGAYYVWTVAEIEQALGKDTSRRFAAVYGLTSRGNFEHGTSVLYLAKKPEEVAAADKMPLVELEKELAKARAKLLDVRSRRTRPGLDRKVLTAWNGMAVSAFALAGAALDERRYVDAARGTAEFILQRHRLAPDRSAETGNDSPLAHSSIDGSVAGPAFLDDYAHFVTGLLDLYHTTLDDVYLLEADRLVREMLDRFGDPAGGALFYAPTPQAGAVQLPVRPRKLRDGSVPSPVAVAWDVLLRLADLTGKTEFIEAASAQERALARVVSASSSGSHFACYVASRRVQPHLLITLVGEPDDPKVRAMVRTIREHAGAGAALLLVAPSSKGERLRALSALARERPMRDGRPTAYVCKGQTCLPPVTDIDALQRLLQPGHR